MENRQRILDAAARVYAEVGFRGATTRRIAAEAGVNEVTLFRIFGSKAALLAEALRCCGPSTDVRPELPTATEDPERELTTWAVAHLGNLVSKAPLIRTMMGEFDERPEVGGMLCEGPRVTHAHLTGYLTQLRRQGRIDTDIPLGVAASMLLGTLFSHAMGRELMPELYSMADAVAARHHVRHFLRGLGYDFAVRTPATAPARSAASPLTRSRKPLLPTESRSRKRS